MNAISDGSNDTMSDKNKYMSNKETFDFNQAIPIIDEDTEFFPLMSPQDEEEMNKADVPEELPILPLRNTVLFPGVVIPITVGREKSIKLIKDSYKGDRTVAVVSQKNMNVEDPEFSDLHRVGTVAHIIKTLQMPDGNTTVILQGKQRIILDELVQEDPYLIAKVSRHPEKKLKKTKE